MFTWINKLMVAEVRGDVALINHIPFDVYIWSGVMKAKGVEGNGWNRRESGTRTRYAVCFPLKPGNQRLH